MAARLKDPQAFLPLTSAVFHILLALSDDDRHGYGIAKEMAAQTGDRVRLGPGTLYGTLARLLDAGLVEDHGLRRSSARGKASADDRRRYYRLTALGRSVLTAEARRLSALVALPSTEGALEIRPLMSRQRPFPVRVALNLASCLVAWYPSALASYRREAKTFLEDAADDAWATRGWRGLLSLLAISMSDLAAVRLRGAPAAITALRIDARVDGGTVSWRGGRSLSVVQDARHACRALARTPGFTAIALITLALGIGANTAMFSLAYAALWRALPFADPDRIVTIAESRVGSGLPADTALPNYRDWRDQNQTLASMAAYTDLTFNLTGTGEPERLNAVEVSASLLSVLGVAPAIGRDFLASDDRPGAAPVAILSHQLWQRTFGADPAITNRTIVLNDRAFAIVGVMPAGFRFPVEAERIDVYTPIEIDAFEQMRRRDGRLVQVVGRLREGVTVESAQQDLAGISKRLEQAHPATNQGWGVLVGPLDESVSRGSRAVLITLLAAVGFVLLMTCTNLANLLLARTASRSRDIAVRAALGASRLRLLGHLLTEASVIAGLGGLAGLLAFVWLRDAIIGLAPQSIPRLDEAGLDPMTLLVAAALTATTAIAIGVGPSLGASNVNYTALGDRVVTGNRSRRRVRATLLVVQIAVGLILLTGAGLMVRSLANLLAIDPGFNSSGASVIALELPRASYGAPLAQSGFYSRVLERAQLVPGLDSVAVAFPLPLGSPVVFPFRIEGPTTLPPGRRLAAFYRTVSADFHRTLGIRLMRGRLFTGDDRPGSTPVIIVNESLASRFFPGQDPIGRRITVVDRNANDAETTREIVGIVSDVRQVSLDRPPQAEMNVPFRQAPSLWMAVVARGPADLGRRVAAEIRTIDPTIPVTRMEMLDARMARSAAPRRFAAVLLTGFGAVAVLLTMIGVTGLTAQAITERTREIGVRIALGARPSQVVHLMVGRTMWLAVGGIAIGLVAEIWLTRLVATLLFGVQPIDLPTFAGAAMALLLLVAGSAYLPARRALGLDPLVALR